MGLDSDVCKKYCKETTLMLMKTPGTACLYIPNFREITVDSSYNRNEMEGQEDWKSIMFDWDDLMFLEELFCLVKENYQRAMDFVGMSQ